MELFRNNNILVAIQRNGNNSNGNPLYKIFTFKDCGGYFLDFNAPLHMQQGARLDKHGAITTTSHAGAAGLAAEYFGKIDKLEF